MPSTVPSTEPSTESGPHTGDGAGSVVAGSESGEATADVDAETAGNGGARPRAVGGGDSDADHPDADHPDAEDPADGAAGKVPASELIARLMRERQQRHDG